MEFCVGAANVPSLGKAVDLMMLAVTGGKERTPDEHRQLLAGAEYRLDRVIPVRDEVVVLEAIPV